MHAINVFVAALLAGSSVAMPRKGEQKNCVFTKTLFPGAQRTATEYTAYTTVTEAVDCHGCNEIAIVSNGGIGGGIPPITTVTLAETGTEVEYTCEPTA